MRRRGGSSCRRARAHGDAALAWDTYKASRKAGTEPSEVALNIIIGVTLMKIRELTDPTRGGGAKEGDREWKEWADRAVAVYHEATVAGVRPRLATFSAMLACLRPPTIPALQAVDRDAGSGSAAAALAHAVSHEDTSHEDARKYYPLRALILYEEAQALGVVPKFHMDRRRDVRHTRVPPRGRGGGGAHAAARVSTQQRRRRGGRGPPKRDASRCVLSSHWSPYDPVGVVNAVP